MRDGIQSRSFVIRHFHFAFRTPHILGSGRRQSASWSLQRDVCAIAVPANRIQATRHRCRATIAAGRTAVVMTGPVMAAVRTSFRPNSRPSCFMMAMRKLASTGVGYSISQLASWMRTSCARCWNCSFVFIIFSAKADLVGGGSF